jgi:hypothetical protein
MSGFVRVRKGVTPMWLATQENFPSRGMTEKAMITAIKQGVHDSKPVHESDKEDETYSTTGSSSSNLSDDESEKDPLEGISLMLGDVESSPEHVPFPVAPMQAQSKVKRNVTAKPSGPGKASTAKRASKNKTKPKKTVEEIDPQDILCVEDQVVHEDNMKKMTMFRHLFYKQAERVRVDPKLISLPRPEVAERNFQKSWGESLAKDFRVSYDADLFQCICAVTIPGKNRAQVTLDDIINAP